MIILDTTVLVYAVGSDHPLREPCRSIVAAISEAAIAATTTVEVVQEFTHVRARRCGRTDAADTARSYAALLAPLLVVDADDLSAGLDLFAHHDQLGAFDCVLAAVALRRRTPTLVSADAAFSAIGALHHVDPAEPDLLAVLGRSPA